MHPIPLPDGLPPPVFGMVVKEKPSKPSSGWRFVRMLGPVGFALGAIVGLVAKLKVPAVLLKTGGTMALSVWVYAKFWGWPFAAGFVLLIFVHECGHIVAGKWF